MYKPKIYTASKLQYADLWRAMREDPDWSFAHFTASWVHSAEAFAESQGFTPIPETLREGWIKDVLDVKQSDFLLLYSRPNEALRGALVEAGVALALGITVVAVGLDLDVHTWMHHPNVVCFPSLREARMYLYKFTAMIPPVRRGRS